MDDDDDEVQITDVFISNENRNKAIKAAVNRRQGTIDGQELLQNPLSSSGFLRASSLPHDPLTKRKRNANTACMNLKEYCKPTIKKQRIEASPGFVQAKTLICGNVEETVNKSKMKGEAKDGSSDEDFVGSPYCNSVEKSLETKKRSKRGKSVSRKKVMRGGKLKIDTSNEKTKTATDDTFTDSPSTVGKREMENKDIDDILLAVESSVVATNKNSEKSKISKSSRDNEDQSGIDYFNVLPLELQHQIFASLADEDLQNCCSVCWKWKQIITDANFMRWKKKYHQLSHQLEKQRGRKSAIKEMAVKVLFGILENTEEVAEKLKADEQAAMGDLLSKVLSYFSSYCPSTGFTLLPYLQQRSLWSSMRKWFAQRFSGSLQPDGEPYPWSFLASCFLLARRVEDTEWVWSSLMRQFSESQAEIIDFLYALAYFLRLMICVSQSGFWFRMHYRIIYRLRQMEKKGVVCVEQLRDRLRGPGQQSIVRYGTGDSKLPLTHEQLKIARHELQHGDVIRINAFAGTGKTTTLLNFSRFNPGLRFILIVYNKAAQEHSKKIFPENVECRTGHSLAFQAVGKSYRHKLGNLNQRTMVDLLSEMQFGEGNLFRRVKLVKNALEGFIASPDKKITREHLQVEAEVKEASQAVLEAKELWKLMQDRSHRCKMTHDGYLKLWQLSEPDLRQYDAILVDEAQDMNPCILDVVMRQKQPKIFVGDPHQQIYSFRGSVNVLGSVNATHNYHLTQSFRFGEPIAFAAQGILSVMKGEEHLILGTDRKSSIHGDFDADGQVTIICRNNATVFFTAYDIARDCSKSIHIIGGLDGLGVDLILQIYYMTIPAKERNKDNHPITDPFLQRFVQPTGSLSSLKYYAEKADDIELMEKIRVVLKLQNLTPTAVSKVKLMNSKDKDRAHHVITTAHKSKGLEFRSVFLDEDLEVDILTDNDVEAVNLLYVAATRAKYFLAMNRSLRRILEGCGENLCQLKERPEQEYNPQEELPVFKFSREPFVDLKIFLEAFRNHISGTIKYHRRTGSWRLLLDIVQQNQPFLEEEEMMEALVQPMLQDIPDVF